MFDRRFESAIVRFTYVSKLGFFLISLQKLPVLEIWMLDYKLDFLSTHFLQVLRRSMIFFLSLVPGRQLTREGERGHGSWPVSQTFFFLLPFPDHPVTFLSLSPLTILFQSSFYFCLYAKEVINISARPCSHTLSLENSSPILAMFYLFLSILGNSLLVV